MGNHRRLGLRPRQTRHQAMSFQRKAQATWDLGWCGGDEGLSVGRADAVSEAFPALILLLLNHFDDACLGTAAQGRRRRWRAPEFT